RERSVLARIRPPDTPRVVAHPSAGGRAPPRVSRGPEVRGGTARHELPRLPGPVRRAWRVPRPRQGVRPRRRAVCAMWHDASFVARAGGTHYRLVHQVPEVTP